MQTTLLPPLHLQPNISSEEHPTNSNSHDSHRVDQHLTPISTLPIGRIPHEEVVDHLVEHAFSIAKQELVEFGNTPTEDHLADIRMISEAMIKGAITKDRFRLCIPLFTGAGKTTALRGVIIALANTNYSMAIAAERIDELIPLRDRLVEMGLQEDKLGVYISNKKREHKHIDVIDSSRIPTTQFLLITHQRVRGGKKVDYNRYQGGKRDLFVWDEVMLTTEGEYTYEKELLNDIHGFASDYNYEIKRNLKASINTQNGDKLLSFIQDVASLLEDALDNKLEVITLPPLDLQATDIKELIGSIRSADSEYKSILKITDWANHDDTQMRIVEADNRGRTALQCVIKIPDSIDKVINLDAGANINKLLAMDKSLQILPTKSSKNYSEVTINHGSIRSSASGLDHLVDQYTKELAHIIGTEIPDNQEVLILGFKSNPSRKRYFQEKLFEVLVKQFGQKITDRVHYLHYGAHKAINDYARIKYVITMGVLYRSLQDISAQLISQSRDKLHPVTQKDANSAIRAEQAHMLYQAFSRGNCRHTHEGKAGDMQIWLFHPDRDKEALKLLEELMPGVVIQTYIPKHLEEYNSSPHRHSASELAEDIASYMADLSDEVMSISKRSIAKKYELASNNRFYKSVMRALEELARPHWTLQKSTFVRVTADL